jgi:hypothetical protein
MRWPFAPSGNLWAKCFWKIAIADCMPLVKLLSTGGRARNVSNCAWLIWPQVEVRAAKHGISGNLVGEGDSCARICLRLFAHHRNDALKGVVPMSLDFHSSVSDTVLEEFPDNERRERIVTVIVATLAVLVVATIALLMGMA